MKIIINYGYDVQQGKRRDSVHDKQFKRELPEKHSIIKQKQSIRIIC